MLPGARGKAEVGKPLETPLQLTAKRRAVLRISVDWMLWSRGEKEQISANMRSVLGKSKYVLSEIDSPRCRYRFGAEYTPRTYRVSAKPRVLVPYVTVLSFHLISVYLL